MKMMMAMTMTMLMMTMTITMTLSPVDCRPPDSRTETLGPYGTILGAWPFALIQAKTCIFAIKVDQGIAAWPRRADRPTGLGPRHAGTFSELMVPGQEPSVH